MDNTGLKGSEHEPHPSPLLTHPLYLPSRMLSTLQRFFVTGCILYQERTKKPKLIFKYIMGTF